MTRFGSVAVLVVAALFLNARPAAAVAPTSAGWWWAAQTGAVPLPSPPTVPAGGLMVGGDPTGANAVAALRFELEPGEGSPVMTLFVADNGDINGATAVLAACPTASAWSSAYAGAWASRPTASCARAVKGERAADGSSWTFNLTPLLVGRVVDVVLQAEAGSNFNLTFNAPTTTTLKTSPPSVAAPATSAADESVSVTASDATGVAAVSDLGGLVLDAPAFTPAPTDLELNAASPGGNRVAVGVPSGATSSARRTSGLAVLLLLGVGLAIYRLNQVPAPAARALGPMTTSAALVGRRRGSDEHAVQVGGLGRFARSRTGAPPRL